MGNIRIQGIEIHRPKNLVDNKYYIDHFEKQNKYIGRLLEAFGKKHRYITDKSTENTVTIAVEAGKKVLESCNLTGEDIDLLVFTTQTPEYFTPTHALIAMRDLGIKSQAQFFDFSASCLGMLNATATIDSMMKGNPRIKKALLLGAENFSLYCDPTNEYNYAGFGDIGCAVVFERTENEDEGILDFAFAADTTDAETFIRSPINGMTNTVFNNEVPMIYWDNSFPAEVFIRAAIETHKAVSERTGIPISDIKHFCPSQYAKPLITNIAKTLNVDEDKFIYVGDKYAYTGTTCPFMALYEGVKSGKIKRGDLVSIWTAGTFWTSCAIYMKY